MPRKRTVGGEGISREQAILLAAERLFSEKSYGKTTISEIARAARVGVGTFYRQFPDKDAVLDKIVRTLFTDIRAQLADARRGIEYLSPLEQLASVRKTYEVVFGVMLERPNLTLTYLRSGYGGGEAFGETVWNLFGEITSDMTEDIGRAEAAGIVSIADKHTFGHAVVGMVLQVVHRMIVEGAPTKDQAVAMCTRMTFGMLSSFVDPREFERLLPVYRMVLPPLPGIDGP